MSAGIGALLSILNRIDALIKTEKELIELLKKQVKPPTDEEPITVIAITSPRLANRYKVITQSLAAALDNEAIGISDLEPTTGHATYMSVIDIGGGFTYKINSAGMDALTAAVGEELEDYEIEEIYVTCGAVGGNAVFYLEYRVEK